MKLFAPPPCARILTCVDGICFDHTQDAAKFVLHLASRRRPVTITRRIDTAPCLP